MSSSRAKGLTTYQTRLGTHSRHTAEVNTTEDVSVYDQTHITHHRTTEQ